MLCQSLPSCFFSPIPFPSVSIPRAGWLSAAQLLCSGTGDGCGRHPLYSPQLNALSSPLPSRTIIATWGQRGSVWPQSLCSLSSILPALPSKHPLALLCLVVPGSFRYLFISLLWFRSCCQCYLYGSSAKFLQYPTWECWSRSRKAFEPRIQGYLC